MEAIAMKLLTSVQLAAMIEALDQYCENQAEAEDGEVPSANLEACRGLLDAAEVERLRRCGAL